MNKQAALRYAGKVADVPSHKPVPRLIQMAEQWSKEGRAFSHIENDDNMFFEVIGMEPIEVGVTSITGVDLIYYDVSIYAGDTEAIKGIKTK